VVVSVGVDVGVIVIDLVGVDVDVDDLSSSVASATSPPISAAALIGAPSDRGR
jgi:hypothetical protein